jgi:hypothetical protein
MLYQLSHVRAHLGCDQNCSRSCRRRKLEARFASNPSCFDPGRNTVGLRSKYDRTGPRPRSPYHSVPYDTDIAQAAALEAIGLISPALPVRTLRQSREAVALAEARTCYDHLAGRAGVGLLDALLGQGLLTREKSKSLVRTDRGDSASTRFVVTGAGARTLVSFGINVTEVRRSRRRFAGECIDWTQRRGHLNGALAAAITARLFEAGWIARGARRRSVLITAAGAQGLADTFGLDLGLRP